MNYFERAKNFRTKKRLGQNFLIDESVIDSIIRESCISQTDVVVEIGAGAGFVTEKLVKNAKHVYAIELDDEAIDVLNKIKADNLTIIHNDILKTDISSLCAEKVTIVANIPYYITSPILVHLLGEIDDLANKNRKSINKIILMVQYEVALRLVADEKSFGKSYGLLSILAQFNADVEIIQKVNRRCFYPAPKVHSALVKLTVNDKPKVESNDYTFLRKVMKACFLTRRKNIKNSLMNVGFSKDAVVKTLEKLNIAENERGETFSIEKISVLAQELKNNL